MGWTSELNRKSVQVEGHYGLCKTLLSCIADYGADNVRSMYRLERATQGPYTGKEVGIINPTTKG